MNCPVDDRELVMSERQGIEIDYCPSCRGVWLDRGELDKLIERSAEPFDVASPGRDARRARDEDHDRDRHGRPKKKKASFLSDLFELGG